MPSSASFWKRVSTAPAWDGVRAQWEEQLGDRYTTLAPFLKVTDQAARAYPCPEPGGENCPRVVVEHADGAIVAVCRSNPPQCDLLRLAKSDVAVYEFSPAALCQWLSSQLGLQEGGDIPALLSARRAFACGGISPLAGLTLTCVLCLSRTMEELDEVVLHLSCARLGHVLLFVPAGRVLSVASRALLEDARSWWCELPDLTTVSGSGELSLAVEARQVIDARVAQLVHDMKSERGSVGFFSTPAGVTWQGLAIKFIDGETIDVSIGNVKRRLSFVLCNMADRRNGKPQLAWKLLELLSMRQGRLSWKDQGASSKHKRTFGVLRKWLKGYFRIPGDPIIYDRKSTAYVVQFVIRPK